LTVPADECGLVFFLTSPVVQTCPQRDPGDAPASFIFICPLCGVERQDLIALAL
jgi:hypothetical protein